MIGYSLFWYYKKVFYQTIWCHRAESNRRRNNGKTGLCLPCGSVISVFLVEDLDLSGVDVLKPGAAIEHPDHNVVFRIQAPALQQQALVVSWLLAHVYPPAAG